MALQPDFRDLLEAFGRHRVQYLVIGGDGVGSGLGTGWRGVIMGDHEERAEPGDGTQRPATVTEAVVDVLSAVGFQWLLLLIVVAGCGVAFAVHGLLSFWGA